MVKTPLFLDYNSTAPLRPEALRAMEEVLPLTGNPSSIHGFGRLVRHHLEKARGIIAERLGAAPHDEVIFTSGGVESNNMLLKTFEALGATILVSATEHKCVLEATATAEVIPVDCDGVLNLTWLKNRLQRADTNKPILVSILWVNNETGVMHPLKEGVALAKAHGAYVHSDIVQALGRLPFSVQDYPVDSLTLSGHKIGGPTGIGALYVKAQTPCHALLQGAGQERKRSGTPNTVGAVGFGAALQASHPQEWEAVSERRDLIENALLSFCPQARIWGQKVPRFSNTISLQMPGVKNETQIMAFDLEGIAVSAGPACSSGTLGASHVLKAMGVSEADASQTIRISLGPGVTQSQCDQFIEAWKKIYLRTRSKG